MKIPRQKIMLFDKADTMLTNFESAKEEEEMDVQKWPTGIYILKIESSGKTETFEVINSGKFRG
jgi:hypothetical protein